MMLRQTEMKFMILKCYKGAQNDVVPLKTWHNL